MEHTEILMLLSQYKYLILIPLLLIQGPIVAIVAGYLATKGVFDVKLLCIFVIIADLVTDTIIYCAGRWGRWTIVARYGKYVGLTDMRLEKAELFMEKHGGKALAIAKVAYSLGTPTMALAGIARMNYVKFILINFLVAVPKSIALVFLGFYVGSNIERALRYLDIVGIGILVLVCLGGIMYWRKKKGSVTK